MIDKLRFGALAACFAVACGSTDGASDSAPESDALPTFSTNGGELPSDRTTDAAHGARWNAATAARASRRWRAASPSEPASPSDPGQPGDPGEPGDPSTPPAPTGTTPPAPPPEPPPARKVPFRGVNLAGGEFGSAIPGRYGTDYTFPTPSEVDYYMARGMNTFRVGFKWERLQGAAYGAFDTAYFGLLDAIVTYATSKGAHVILNPHNFARYYGSPVGSSQVPNAAFADFWSKLSSKYASNANVLFNLVNEPNTMPTEQWVSAANAAIAAIRKAGAHNTIVAPGNAWTGGASWYSSGYGTPNAVAMLAIDDPEDNVWFEAHQYLDSDASGGSGTCVSKTAGSERLAPFVKWLRDNKKKGFLGEFAGADNPTCNAAITDMLSYVMSASDVLMGWTWWAGGPWWGNYQFTLEPTSSGAERPQWSLLAPFLSET